MPLKNRFPRKNFALHSVGGEKGGKMREVSYYILYLLLLYKCVSQNLLLALSAGWDQEETALSDQRFSPEVVKSTLLRLTNKGLIKKYIIAYELIGEKKEAVTQWITKEKVYLCKKGIEIQSLVRLPVM